MKKHHSALKTLLSSNQLEYAGIRECFLTFFSKIKEQLLTDSFLSRDVDEHMNEINDYIMIRLYRYIFEASDQCSD